MALTTFYTPRWRAIDENGEPISGAILSFFEAGTATPLPVYADVDGNTALGVTVDADGGGLFPEMFMLPQAYDITLTTADGDPVWTAVDWFPPQAASSANLDVEAIAGVTFTAGEGAYVSDGSGGLNAGQMYKWDADLEYASATPELYTAVSGVTAGDSGLFRQAGIVSGLSGLIPGQRYYVSGTAGAIATTPGTFPRMVGQAKSTTELFLATNPHPVPVVDAKIKTLCNFRLSLTTGVPITTADVTGGSAVTLFLVPYQGNEIGLYTGVNWAAMALAQLSLAVPATTATMYDVFVDYNDGVPQLAVTAWTNDTTRATALTTQDGVLVKTGDTQQRYVGSFRTGAVSGQTEDSATKRYLWNYYNRVVRPLLRLDTTVSWNYSLATWRQARADTANQLDVVVGVAEVPIDVLVKCQATNDTGTMNVSLGVGEDSTTAPVSAAAVGNKIIITASSGATIQATLQKYPAIGRHFYVWLESAQAVGTTTFFGASSSGPASSSSTGSQISGWIQG